jgi:hypothetical protein
MQLLDRLAVLSRRFYNKTAELLYSSGFILNLTAVQQVAELEEENKNLKDEMAMMAMEGHVAGFGGDLSAEEHAYQQAKQRHSS